jgi:hypothetical protein
MAGATKRIKPRRSPRGSDSVLRDRVTVRRVARARMLQALEILGLSTEGEALPSGRFALIELGRRKGEDGVRRIFETPATEHPSCREELRGAARRAEIVAHATEALDGQANAMHWLQEANRSLGGRSPLAVLTEDAPEAAELVDELLYGIEYGMFA